VCTSGAIIENVAWRANQISARLMLIQSIGSRECFPAGFTRNPKDVLRSFSNRDVCHKVMIYFFSPQNSRFGHNRFSTLFFSQKIVLVSCIIDLKDIQVWLRQFSLNLNVCKVMMVFFKIWPDKIKKVIIPLQASVEELERDIMSLVGMTYLSNFRCEVPQLCK
jgi:hypothetical protein